MVTLENITKKVNLEKEQQGKIIDLAQKYFGTSGEIFKTSFTITQRRAGKFRFTIVPSINYMKVYDKDLNSDILFQFGEKYEELMGIKNLMIETDYDRY